MKLILVLVVFLTTLSCYKEELSPNSCQVKNPVIELSWLQDRIARYNTYGGELTVSQATYQGQTIFSIDLFMGIDASSAAFYRCDGTLICTSHVTIGGLRSDCGALNKDITNYSIIYKNSN